MDQIIKLLLFLVFIPSCVLSQNVGINTNNPTKTLDVNGDLNIAGDLSANGLSGQAGDMLMSNGDGTISWANISGDYKYYQTYSTYGNEVFTVPNGVNEIMVEMWGAGGRGYQGGGGGSGAYLRVILDVNPADMITFTIGRGSWSGSPASNSAFIYGGITYLADGGFDASVSSSGFGGYVLYASGNPPRAFARPGNSGESTHIKYSQINSNDHLREHYYGDGAAAPFSNGIGRGIGGYRSLVNGTTLNLNFNGKTAQSGGHGGGGSISYTNGGDGLIIIRWNQ